MPTLTMRGGYVVQFDAEDAHIIGQYTWHRHRAPTTIYARGYLTGSRYTGLVYMHRLLLGAVSSQEVDHRNGDGLDNRRGNLRLCESWQNKGNRGRVTPHTSRYKGVCFDKRRACWRATITCHGRQYALGWFADEKQAADAYRVAAERLFGEFANTGHHDLPAMHTAEPAQVNKRSRRRIEAGAQ